MLASKDVIIADQKDISAISCNTRIISYTLGLSRGQNTTNLTTKKVSRYRINYTSLSSPREGGSNELENLKSYWVE